jgi:hypothetical protein
MAMLGGSLVTTALRVRPQIADGGKSSGYGG